jgi:hypothetical protein
VTSPRCPKAPQGAFPFVGARGRAFTRISAPFVILQEGPAGPSKREPRELHLKQLCNLSGWRLCLPLGLGTGEGAGGWLSLPMGGRDPDGAFCFRKLVGRVGNCPVIFAKLSLGMS